jgi:hypothetical protein
MMHGLETAAGKETEDPRHEEEKNSRESSPFECFHRLLDQEKAKEKERQNEGGSSLALCLLLAEEMPEKMKAQVQDDQMVENADHGR